MNFENIREAYISEIRENAIAYNGIVIYGAGKYGRELLKLLRENGINVEAFCVTEKEHNLATIGGLPVFSLEEVKANLKSFLILVAVKSPTNKELISNLEKYGFDSFMDIPGYFDEMMNDVFFRPILEVTPKAGCSVHCKYCPQDLFLGRYYEKTNVKEMTFDVFKQCIDKTPENLMIDFSGFVEPFLAKDAIKMMRYAHDIGRDMRLFTTLVGLDKKGFDEIKSFPFKSVVLHLPDKNGYANIPTTNEYWGLLKYVVEANKVDGSAFVDMANCQCEPHPKAVEIVGKRIMISWNLIDRAGNLSDDELQSAESRKGKLYCRRANKLDHNVLLPNGDVILCCMDFGMECLLGNLLEESYSEIIDGKMMQRVQAQLANEKCDSLCRRCTEAKNIS